MFPWKQILTTFIIGLLCISNPASARFLSNDPVSAQTHIQQGNVQGFNRYTYVNNNPYKFTDPDGRKLQYVGDSQQQARLKAIVSNVSAANGLLKARINELEASKYTHIIDKTEAGELPYNIPMGAEGRQGVGSVTGIPTGENLVVPPEYQENFTSSVEAVAAHEIGGHAWEVNRGIADDNIGQSGLKRTEENAREVGNVYRSAKGEKLREIKNHENTGK